MYAVAARSWRWAFGHFGFDELVAQLVRPVTGRRAERGLRLVAHDAEGHALPAAARLRIATVVALSTGIMFLPLEARSARSDVLFDLLLLYGAHTLLSSFLLIASHTAWGTRNAERLTVVLVLGHAVNVTTYVYLWPQQPGLAGGVLSCLLVGSTVLFSWSTRRALMLSILVCFAFALVARAAVPPGADFGPFTVATIVLCAGAVTAIGSARVLGMLRTSLAARQSELTALSESLMSVQEDERRRLSRELHDEFGQSLTAVNTYLWLIERQLPPQADTLKHRASEARRLVRRTLGAMRELSQLLRPSVLDDLGLVPSLESQLQAFAKRHTVTTNLNADGLPTRLAPEVETALYRITQEALTNVARHARAKRVRVALTTIGGELRLEIEDDGVGLPPRGSLRSGVGLIGIRERARALGGTATIRSDKGTRLEVRLPFAG